MMNAPADRSFFAPFGGRTKNPSTPPAPLAAEPVAEVAQAIAQHDIGPGMCIYGTLSFPGRTVIAGTVNGDIKGDPESTVVVTEQGVVEGPIEASEVIVQGRITGDITADKVHVHASARVIGTIRARYFQVEPGSFLQGGLEINTDPVATPAIVSQG